MHLLVTLAALGLALSQRVEQVMVAMRDGGKICKPHDLKFFLLQIITDSCFNHVFTIDLIDFIHMFVVELNTIIAFPRDFDKTQNKATIIMDRSPYGAMALELIDDIFVPFGFITVGQDMRGTG